jgi:DsbC/DsbD-like thiol-disulfide interchange protein
MKTILGLLFALAAFGGDWSQAVEVRHEDALAISYQARFDGPYLVVRATIGPGWHTFAMDNKRRAEEKLAGKPAISNDRATEIKAVSGVAVSGPWLQSSPKDFSHPELRWFSWGFERQAVFAVKARATGGAAQLRLQGQACTETICKNIDVTLTAPGGKTGAAAETNVKELVEVK